MSQLHVHATQGHERSWLPPALSPLMKIPGSARTSLDPREDRKCPRNPGFFGRAPDDPSGLRRDGPRAGLTPDTHRVDCTIVTARRPFSLYSVASYRPNPSPVMTLDACCGAKSRIISRHVGKGETRQILADPSAIKTGLLLVLRRTMHSLTRGTRHW
ncbi:hypothetical protein LX32DRAFT_412348 [Colletotrichum zoysiae]|uniref:Uncharacterized protein n=1 Tax=Colletotrichum zoysiae TaxID=1216348 RepID=A0AAD9HFR3_9PEZI|nr:hypothetical protein LX32DRAFT_412348 [Colletotrichum zoysiae]